MGAEVALGFLAGIAAFVLVSLAIIAGNSDGLILILVAVCIATIAMMFRNLGVEYAVPAALAAVLAFDWFYIPPTHPHNLGTSSECPGFCFPREEAAQLTRSVDRSVQSAGLYGGAGEVRVSSERLPDSLTSPSRPAIRLGFRSNRNPRTRCWQDAGGALRSIHGGPR